jgi:hypothetical protein
MVQTTILENFFTLTAMLMTIFLIYDALSIECSCRSFGEAFTPVFRVYTIKEGSVFFFEDNNSSLLREVTHCFLTDMACYFITLSFTTSLG